MERKDQWERKTHRMQEAQAQKEAYAQTSLRKRLHLYLERYGLDPDRASYIGNGFQGQHTKNGYSFHRSRLKQLAATYVRRPDKGGGSLHVSSPVRAVQLRQRAAKSPQATRADLNTVAPNHQQSPQLGTAEEDDVFWTLLPASNAEKRTVFSSGQALRPLLLAGEALSIPKPGRKVHSSQNSGKSGNLVSRVVGTFISTHLMPHPQEGMGATRYTVDELERASKQLSQIRKAW